MGHGVMLQTKNNKYLSLQLDFSVDNDESASLLYGEVWANLVRRCREEAIKGGLDT